MIIKVNQEEYSMIKEALTCYVEEIDRNVRHLNGNAKDEIKFFQWRLDGLLRKLTGARSAR